MICLHFEESIFAGSQYWRCRPVLIAVVVVIVAAVDKVTDRSASDNALGDGARDLSRVEFEERISVRRSWCALWHSFDLLDRLLELPTDCKLLFQAKKKRTCCAMHRTLSRSTVDVDVADEVAAAGGGGGGSTTMILTSLNVFVVFGGCFDAVDAVVAVVVVVVVFELMFEYRS